MEEVKDDNANYDYSSVPMAGLPMIGALMGMCLGGPVGILAGVKIGGLAAVGGSILGYTGASVVSEQKELREYIDEHYEQQPELYVQTPMEEALAKRRSSRSLPELPGPGDSRRALASAKYRQGPNGYRRPSLVRATSLDAQLPGNRGHHQPTSHRLSEFQGRHPPSGYPGSRGRGLGGEGSGRKLPSRPSFSRTSYSIEQVIYIHIYIYIYSVKQDGWHSRASNPGRRPPLLRHNSNLHRKMSYRQSNNNLEGYNRERRSHSSFRRYEGGGGGGGYLDDRGGGWTVADFQRQASIEDRAYERRRMLVRQHSQLHRGELD